jgi:hypothetical protein
MKYGYIDALLSNLAADYSLKAREGLVGAALFPRVTVGRPSGKYAVFDKASAYKVPDVTMAGERAQAHEFNSAGAMKSYTTTPYALKSFIDSAELEVMDGPFRHWERQKVEALATNLERAQEKRIADKVLSLTGRTTALTGAGTASGNKWSAAGGSTGGDPFEAIQGAVKNLFYRPNLMVLSESVFDALEFHPRLIDKLGDAFNIKKVNEETLGKLFRVDTVMIAKGRADFKKKNAEGSSDPKSIWGDSVVLAYTSATWNEPCAGKTISVKYAEADGQGYIVRRWDEEDGGLLGGEYVQVGHEVEELVVASDLIYSLTQVL